MCHVEIIKGGHADAGDDFLGGACLHSCPCFPGQDDRERWRFSGLVML